MNYGVSVKITNAWNPHLCKVFIDGEEPELLYRYVINDAILRLDKFKPGENGNVYTITPDDPQPQLLTEYYPIASVVIDSGIFGE
jgi:hypothetical protein